MSHEYSATVTLDSLKESKTIPVLGINSGDFWIVAGLAAAGYFIPMSLGWGLLALALSVGIGTIVGIDLVRSAPPYCNAIQWVRAVIKYYRSPGAYADAKHAHVETKQSLRAAIETPASTREQTHITRFYPPYGVFERVDGSMGAMLEYQPPNMDFATDEQYVDLMNMISGWYNNNEIEFDITVHATTQPADVEAYFDRLNERISDPEASYNETFRMLLEEMRQDRQRQLQASDTEILRVYLIIGVEPDEVADVVGGDDSATDRSRLFRLVSRLLPSQGALEEDIPEDADRAAVKRRRMEKKLNHRIGRVKELAIGHNIADANIRQLSAPEAAAVFESYWTGRDLTDISGPGERGTTPSDPLSPGVDTEVATAGDLL